MSIIRSNIARQLLAEGGAPRASFRSGGQGRDRDVQMSGVAPSTDYSSFGGDQEADVARMEAAMNINQPPGSLSDEDAKALSYVNFNRPTRTPDRFSFGFSDVNPFPLITTGLTGIDNFIGRVTKRDKYNLARRTDFLRKQGLIGPGEEDEKYTDAFLLSPEGLNMLKGMGYTTIQDVINKNRGEGGDNEPIKRLRAPITEKKEEPKGEFDDILKFYGAKFEDGGEVRQNYGLGSIVKKATRAVKKVAKSPLGKAALIGGLGFLGAQTPFGQNLLTDFKKLSAIKQAMTIGGIGLTAAPFFLGEEEEEEKLPTQAQSDPEFQNLLAFYGGPRRFAESGGDIEDAPMETASKPSTFGELNQLSMDLFGRPYDKLNDSEQEILIEYFTRGKKMPGRAMAAEGGMMDLGGNEMDLRGGGFVPLGAKEKADDVPARLSKNEFVMTADAVRAAGGGSVDRGADIMYKTMKTLENKVA